MSPWGKLSQELDRWRALERDATLWWRDDDAVEPSAPLQRLLALQRRRAVPLALAVIPANAQPALAQALEAGDRVAVLQHGYAHENHAGEGERAIELGGHRQAARVADELQQGWRILQDLFAGRSLPVMVPPWNRIAPELIPSLRALGYRALSCFSARRKREAAPGLLQANCHVDIIDWRRGRRFRGEEDIIDQLCAHLQARRDGRADPGEASGILSHHLVHDENCWRFLDTLFEQCARHPGARWLEADEACLAQ